MTFKELHKSNHHMAHRFLHTLRNSFGSYFECKRKIHLLWSQLVNRRLFPFSVHASCIHKNQSNQTQKVYLLIRMDWLILLFIDQHSDWFFCWIIRSIVIHWLSYSTVLLRLSIGAISAMSLQKCWSLSSVTDKQSENSLLLNLRSFKHQKDYLYSLLVFTTLSINTDSMNFQRENCEKNALEYRVSGTGFGVLGTLAPPLICKEFDEFLGYCMVFLDNLLTWLLRHIMNIQVKTQMYLLQSLNKLELYLFRQITVTNLSRLK